jgi:hypothetical protein
VGKPVSNPGTGARSSAGTAINLQPDMSADSKMNPRVLFTAAHEKTTAKEKSTHHYERLKPLHSNDLTFCLVVNSQ